MAKPVRQLSNINIIVQKGLAAANEIFEQLDEKNENNSGEVDSRLDGVIDFNDVSFSYDTGGQILSNISFHINKHDTVAIVGRSGSGKSTIANLIPRFYDHSSGEIMIDGISIKDYSLTHLSLAASVESFFHHDIAALFPSE